MLMEILVLRHDCVVVDVKQIQYIKWNSMLLLFIIAEITEFEINEEDETDDLPFACYICRGDFKNPVVTRL